MTVTEEEPITFADQLRRVADHFQTSPFATRTAIFSEIHMACGAYGRIDDYRDYANKIDAAYQALADEAGCTPNLLDHTLEALDLRTELPDIIRRAAKRIEER